jgi:hypothetical protein
MQLNNKQSEAIHKLDQFATQDKDRYFYLFGYAGAGKTYIISRSVISLLEHKLIDCAYVCAPTHVALNVLESYFKTNFDNDEQKELLKKIKFLTIHKLLEFKPSISNETGTKVFRATKESKHLKQMSNKLVIIDECSMISKSMVQEIDKYIQQYYLKIVFLGDIAQLRPVSESKSLVFNLLPLDYAYHIILDEIMRTKSPSIKLVSKIIREWDPNNKSVTLCNMLLPIHKQPETPKSFRLYHKNDDYANTTWFKYVVKKISLDTMPIILTWRNATADFYNQIIREHIHQTTELENYKEGDFLMFNNFYASLDIGDEPGLRFYTSNVIKIIKIKSKKRRLIDWTQITINSDKVSAPIMTACNTLLRKLNKFQTEFIVDKCIANKIHNNPDDTNNIGKACIILTINRSNLAQYYDLRKTVQEHLEFFFHKYKSEEVSSILWQAFHKNLIDPYADLTFGYSITTHKAQGSTFDIVLVDFDDVVQNRNIGEMQEMLYTSSTRASAELGFLL